MKSRIHYVVVASLAFLVFSPPIRAGQRLVGSGVDARGVRHYAANPQWIADAIVKRRPEYPYSERVLHHEGSGLFRILVDLKTGSVTSVSTMQSTGFPKLDEAAIKAFRASRWRPGTWKELDLVVDFTMSVPPRS
jgi:TonB family protein